MNMTLTQYAKQHGIKYRAAWNRFKAGKIPGAFKDEYGKILIRKDIPDRPIKVVCYARVSSSQNKNNLEKQAQRLVDFANASGYSVTNLVKEIGSGLNDTRKKLIKVLEDPDITHIIIEHKDRLTRFGFNYLEHWMEQRQVKIIVINEVDTDKQDLMQDFVSLVTSFVARLYGLRRSKRKTEKLIEALQNENSKIK